MTQFELGGLDGSFWQSKPLIGMVHLQPLPGSAGDRGLSLDDIVEAALADAHALEGGGASAIIVENFFDAPFAKDSVPPHTTSAMTIAVHAVRAAVSIPIGVNVLRNDGISAMAIAHICRAQFIRVNVWVGAAVTDQGIIEGAARDVVRYRRELGAQVSILADVFVKHAVQLGGGSLQDAARDAAFRGRADALIVTGAATGAPASVSELEMVKRAVADTPVLVGSGVDVETIEAMLCAADGAIVGSSLKVGGIDSPVDPHRVRALRAAMDRTVCSKDSRNN